MLLKTPPIHRVFLLSPAHCGGKRAGFVLNERAEFSLARRIREPTGVALGELFSFLSGLYFRGKLAYATAFSRPPSDIAGIWVITSNRGLLPTETPITVRDLQAFARVPVKVHERRYRTPLIRDAERLADTLPAHCDVVLLGSVATTKYVDLLTRCFGNRLRFPAEFVGRGDMSRGGLLLRCVAAGTELNYVPVDGATRRGRRPPKLSAGYR